MSSGPINFNIYRNIHIVRFSQEPLERQTSLTAELVDILEVPIDYTGLLSALCGLMCLDSVKI